MKVELPPVLAEQLHALPESGMGYQVVRVLLKDGKIWDHVLVFNGEEMELPEGATLQDAAGIVSFELELGRGRGGLEI